MSIIQKALETELVEKYLIKFHDFNKDKKETSQKFSELMRSLDLNPQC